MPEILDKLQSFASNKLNQKSQPGDAVERDADSGVNNSTKRAPPQAQAKSSLSNPCVS